LAAFYRGIATITNRIFLSYTYEELKSLQDFIKTSSLYMNSIFGPEIMVALKHCLCNPHQLSQYPFSENTDFEVFTMDFKKLPLLINDEDSIKAGVARWRLSRGE
jgi:hypothetical protein